MKSKNLEVVALALDTISGEILNATKVAVAIPTSIDNIENESNVRVVSNNGEISLNFNELADYIIELYSVNGILLKKENTYGAAVISLGSLEGGLYVVKVKGENFSSVHKIYVEK